MRRDGRRRHIVRRRAGRRPPGAPGAAFLADLVDEAAREEEWASGEEARGVVAGVLGWMVANADEVMGQAEVSGGAGAGKAVAAAAGDDGGRAGSGGVLLTRCGHSIVQLQWRGRHYKSSKHVVLRPRARTSPASRCAGGRPPLSKMASAG